MARKKKTTEDAEAAKAPETPPAPETPAAPEVPVEPTVPSPAPEPPKQAPLLPTVKDELDDPFGMVGFID